MTLTRLSCPAVVLASTWLSACVLDYQVGKNLQETATDDPDPSTTTQSETAVCGDGVVSDDEACDDGNDAPDDGCGSYQALYRRLEHVEEDTHLHIHKENNILFPMAEAIQARS